MPMKLKRRLPPKKGALSKSKASSTSASLPTHETQAWVHTLEQGLSESPKQNTQSPKIQEIIFFVLYKHPDRSQDGLQIELFLARQQPNGKIGTPQKTSLSRLIQLEYQAQAELEYIAQIESAHRLSNPRDQSIQDRYLLNGFYAEKLLPHLIQTRRCHWQSLQTAALHLGEKKSAHWQWQLDESGNQTLTCDIQGKKTPLLALEQLWYLDLEHAMLGPIQSTFPQKIQLALSQTPSIKPEDCEKLQPTFKKLAREFSIPTPQMITKQVIQNTPIPHLHLFKTKLRLRNNPSNPWEVNETESGLAQLSFIYGDCIFPWESFSKIEKQFKGKIFFEIHRMQDQENAYRDQLTRILNDPIEYQQEILSLNPKCGHYYLIDPLHWENIMSMTLALRDQGWQVQLSADFPYQILDIPKPDWYSDIQENANTWFDFELGIILNGEKINILPILKNLFDEISISGKTPCLDAPSVLVQLPNKQYIALPTDRLKSILNTLLDLHQTQNEKNTNSLRLNKWELSKLLEIEHAFQNTPLRWQGQERILSLLSQFKQLNELPPATPPKYFHGTLRSYQLSGVAWLQFLRKENLNGILADDMGLGKTIQTLAHIALEKESGRTHLPCLIVSPTSLVFNWESEIKKFSPNLSYLILQGSERKKYFQTAFQYDIVLTSYALLIRDQEALLQQNFYLSILDEAQYIKNSKSQAMKIASQIQSEHKLCLTGTPIENHLGEIWSLFHFLMPGFLGSEKSFNQHFKIPIENSRDSEKLEKLKLRTTPFILRRTKEKVLPQLPEKIEMIRQIELEGDQRDLYETFRISLQKKLQDEIEKLGFHRTHIMILDALLKLRQICCDPRLLKNTFAQSMPPKSAKLNFLMDFLPELLQEGRRILLFSQFTEMLGLIEAELTAKNIPYVKLTGKTQDRATPVQTFQTGKVPLFLISLKAGGTGLNLTAADTVIHYDPWWNPAVERQASDRAHRIGQDKTVFIYKLIAKGTLEEKMLALQEKKSILFQQVLNPDAQSLSSLSEHDLTSLFEPLN